METSRKRARFKGSIRGGASRRERSRYPVTLGGKLNHRMERIVFDVAEIPLPYNGILGRPALAKFMAAPHYAYNMLKMPGPMTIITVPCDKKDALICADLLYREAVAAAAAKALAPAAESLGGKKKAGKTSRTHSGKCTSSECCATVEDVPESSTGKSKKSRAAPPETKKVSVKDGTGGAFTISSTLDGK